MAGDGNDPDDLIVQAFKAYDMDGKISWGRAQGSWESQCSPPLHLGACPCHCRGGHPPVCQQSFFPSCQHQCHLLHQGSTHHHQTCIHQSHHTPPRTHHPCHHTRCSHHQSWV